MSEAGIGDIILKEARHPCIEVPMVDAGQFARDQMTCQVMEELGATFIPNDVNLIRGIEACSTSSVITTLVDAQESRTLKS